MTYRIIQQIISNRQQDIEILKDVPNVPREWASAFIDTKCTGPPYTSATINRKNISEDIREKANVNISPKVHSLFHFRPCFLNFFAWRNAVLRRNSNNIRSYQEVLILRYLFCNTIECRQQELVIACP